MRIGRVAAVVATVLVVLVGCGDDSDETSSGDDGTGGTGTVAVHIEPVEGFFIEGFELGLRFSDTDGNEIDRVRWTDFVQSLGSTELDAFYTSVYEQEVPAGVVVVEADVNVGIGPPAEPPDLDAEELPCRLEIEVPEGETVEVEVAFTDADCLSKLTT